MESEVGREVEEKKSFWVDFRFVLTIESLPLKSNFF